MSATDANNIFAIGAQYYRAPSPREENWERDIAAAREHGLNIMRAWVMWRWYNHVEGRYDFSELHRLHGIFEKNEMRLVFLIHLESPPAWLINRYPQARYVDHEGKTLHPETVPSVSAGGFPGLCFHNEPVVEEAKKFIGRLVSEFSGSETVFAWEPHNEPQIEASRYGSGVYCYCDGSIRKFRLWLRRRYGDIENLNRAWTARFGAFDEIQPPRYRRTWADWVDWRLFMAEALAEMEQWRIAEIRAHTRQKVISHIGSESSVNNDMAVCGFDDWRLAPQPDMYGVAGFPQVQSLGGLVSGISVIRSASRDKESWAAELQAGDYGLGFNRRSYRGVRRPVHCSSCDVVARGLEAEGKTRMVVVYNTADAPRGTTLTVSESGALTDMETGETLRAAAPRDGGAGIELELELEPYGSRMLRLD